jgi:hypothetical protein
VDLGRFFSFLIYTQLVGLLGRGDQPVARPLSIHRTTQTQNKRTQASMSGEGFEPTIPVFERAKKVHALDGAAICVYAHTYQVIIHCGRMLKCNVRFCFLVNGNIDPYIHKVFIINNQLHYSSAARFFFCFFLLPIYNLLSY